MDYVQVKKCIMSNCNKNAVSFTGHLHSGTEIIDAGFCREHSYRAFNPGPGFKPIHGCKMKTGCFGKWKEKYGKEPYNVLDIV